MVGLKFLSLKIQNYVKKVWLICLPAVMSACIFKDTLRIDTQVFFIFKISIYSLHTEYQLRFISINTRPDQSNHLPRENQRFSCLMKSYCTFPVLLQSLVQVNISNSVAILKTSSFWKRSTTTPMFPPIQTLLLWSNYRVSRTRSAITPDESLILRFFPEHTQKKLLQRLPWRRPNAEFLQTTSIQTSQLSPMVLGGNVP